jgi:hypothetical protein
MVEVFLFLWVKPDKGFALENLEGFENRFVHFFDSILKYDDNDFIGVNSLFVEVDDILTDALQSVVEHTPIFIVHADANGHFEIAMCLHLTKDVVSVL